MNSDEQPQGIVDGGGIVRTPKKRGPKPGSHVNPAYEWKKGQTGNPHGAPRKGCSIAETIRTVRSMTPIELAELFRRLGSKGRSGLEQSLASLPQHVPLGMLQHASAMISTICEPNASLNSYLADRDEGPMPTQATHTGAIQINVVYDDHTPAAPKVIEGTATFARPALPPSTTEPARAANNPQPDTTPAASPPDQSRPPAGPGTPRQVPTNTGSTSKPPPRARKTRPDAGVTPG